MKAGIAVTLLLALAHTSFGAEATFTVKQLTPETALKAAQAALAACRAKGYQVSVSVVDRDGVVQVLLRDRFAGPHTLDMAAAKAWTAVSFRTDTRTLAQATQSGPQSGVRHRPGVAAVGGGLMIEASGSLLGGIGVSGAPGGVQDESCAEAGISAIREDIEL